jgi:RNA polymerase sigma-70 factor (ECF subfamily)
MAQQTTGFIAARPGDSYRVRLDDPQSESRERAIQGFADPSPVTIPGRQPSPHSMLVRSRSKPREFVGFYNHFAPRVLAYFMRHTEVAQVAYDLMSKTFVEAFAARDNYKGSKDREAAGWLWTIARHELSKYTHSRKVEKTTLERLNLERPMPSDQELRDLERLLVLERMVREHLPAAMSQLTADHRQVVRLRFYEDLSNEEIAEQLSVSQAVVRSRLSRALKILRKYIPRDGAIEVLAEL